MRVAALPLLALACFFGCVQGEEAVTLFPNGSGKLEIRVAFKRSLLKLAEEGAKRAGRPAPPDILETLADPATLARIGEGVTAWKAQKVNDQGEWARMILTAYFENINLVKIRSFDEKAGADGSPKLIFSARLIPGDGGGGTLHVTTHLTDTLKDLDATRARAKDDEAAKAAIDAMKPLYAEMKGRIRVTAPGDIRSLRGFMGSEGRTASLAFDGTQILGLLTDPENADVRRFEELLRTPAELTWSEPTVTPEEYKAFREEFEAAKGVWAQVRGGGPARPAPGPTAAPEKPKSLGADADQFTDDEVDRLFIDAQIKIAREQIERGQKDKARATLEGVLKDFPKAKAAQEAKKILDGLK